MEELINIEDVLGEVDGDAFIDRYCGKDVLCVRGSPQRYAAIAREVALFERLADPGFYRRVPVLMRRDSSGREDEQRQLKAYNLDEAIALFRGGYSVYLSNYQELLSPNSSLLAIARSIQALCGYPLHSLTCFCSPPDARAMQAHTDTYDVYTLQVLGSKKWNIEGALPHGQAEDSVGSQSAEARPAPHTSSFTLRAGDFFYVPANVRHSVESLEDVSLSIAIVVRPLTIKDITEIAVEAYLRSPRLPALPPLAIGHSQEERLELVAKTLVELSGFIEQMSPEAVVGGLARNVVRNPLAAATVDFRDIVQSAETARIEPRPALAWQKGRDPTGGTRFWFSGGRSVRVPRGVSAELERFLTAGQRVEVLRLFPELDLEEKSRLVRSLIEAGAVARCRT